MLKKVYDSYKGHTYVSAVELLWTKALDVTAFMTVDTVE